MRLFLTKDQRLVRDSGFVLYKVFDVERLVGNLCTVWIGRHRIHANAARFHRPKGSTSSHQPAMKGKIRDSSIGNTKDNGHRDDVSSYANVVKNQSQGNGENDSKPVLVLDDSCVNTQDYSCCLNGKVKEVGVLENLKVALGNEGFTIIEFKYMGCFLIQASSEFITDERVTMVEIEGIPLKVRRIGCRSKEISVDSNLDDQNDEEMIRKKKKVKKFLRRISVRDDDEYMWENNVSRVSDTEVEEENPKSKDGVVSSEQNGKQSEDPFNIYSLLNKDKMKNNKEASTKRVWKSEGFSESGSYINVMDELVKVGQTMGYNMDGCMKNIEEIIESQGVDGVFR
ncbi:hypothetical protein Tco_1155243 [Tanacetum coccineum]